MDLLHVVPNWIINLTPYYDVEITQGGTFIFHYGENTQVRIYFYEEMEKQRGTDMEKVEASLFFKMKKRISQP